MISAEIDAVVTIVKEKTTTWNKSRRESAKRESELYKMVEQAAIRKARAQRKKHAQGLATAKERDEEEEARGRVEEMQRNLDEAQGRVLGEYIYSYEKEMGRPRCGR